MPVPVSRAMEIVATLGRIYGAPDLVPVTHVQIAGVSYKNLGDAGVEFLNQWADDGVRVPTTLKPSRHGDGSLAGHGHQPQLLPNRQPQRWARSLNGRHADHELHAHLFPDDVPQRGDHLAWAEKAGCRLCQLGAGCAPTARVDRPRWLPLGRTPRYGYHLDGERPPMWSSKSVVRCAGRRFRRVEPCGRQASAAPVFG